VPRLCRSAHANRWRLWRRLCVTPSLVQGRSFPLLAPSFIAGRTTAWRAHLLQPDEAAQSVGSRTQVPVAGLRFFTDSSLERFPSKVCSCIHDSGRSLRECLSSPATCQHALLPVRWLPTRGIARHWRLPCGERLASPGNAATCQHLSTEDLGSVSPAV
jgi:hypothetical protein